MNAQSCASPAARGANWRPTEYQRNALIRAIEELEASLKSAEAAAAAKGFGDYLAVARESLAIRMAEELHAACAPDEPEALLSARTAIADFHDQMTETRPASGPAGGEG